MKTPISLTTRRACRSGARLMTAAGALMVLAACQFNQQTNSMSEGIGYREARFQEISAMRDFRDCRDRAVELDSQARANGAAAQYLASAKLLQTCEANVGPDAASVAKDERMRAYALSVQNFLKGGDVGQARESLRNFKQAFPQQDLYFADGASFIDTMEILTGEREVPGVGSLALVNASSALKDDLRRMRYWQRN